MDVIETNCPTVVGASALAPLEVPLVPTSGASAGQKYLVCKVLGKQ